MASRLARTQRPPRRPPSLLTSTFTPSATLYSSRRAAGTTPLEEGQKRSDKMREEWQDELKKLRAHIFYTEMKKQRAAQSESWTDFKTRHIGPRDADVANMLAALGSGVDSLDSLVAQVIPANVMAPDPERDGASYTEAKMTELFNQQIESNEIKLWLNGRGYYPVEVPPVIKRNIFENPAWYTSYTPYQAEISQGRLESLLNFQTMVSDLTGLSVSNASLLDEGTAAAEAMTISLNSLGTARAKRPDKVYVVSALVHEATIKVMRGRAEGFGIRLQLMNFNAPSVFDQIRDLGDDLVGILAQYPDTLGGVQDFRAIADLAHEQGTLFSVATDLSALTLLKPPGEWGADVAFGNSQRFGVPLGYGGPHAAFMAVKEALKRRLPGRLVGVSKDRTGGRALRLALQTREQHIRREKATSNVCTAQALLANMAAMYAIYYGPRQLKEMAVNNLRFARMVQATAVHYGLRVQTRTLDSEGPVLSDTVALRLNQPLISQRLRTQLNARGIQAGKLDASRLLFAMPSVFQQDHYLAIVQSFKKVSCENRTDKPNEVASRYWREAFEKSSDEIVREIPNVVRRETRFLTHPVFNSHHSETEMLRYIHHLQSKDLSLVHSMIPLGSCTMKLNATSQIQLPSHEKAANMHPFAARPAWQGYSNLMSVTSDQLARITGMHATCLQPNSGAQGEFAGLRVIRKYHEQKPGSKRDICLIPVSAHGTNPASAIMAGMRVVPVRCDPSTGNLDLIDLEAKCEQYADELGAIMITYPNTFGVFEPGIHTICQIVHDHGGLVYMDGANMNAQIGLTSPGALGADVCHLNLHKTFCIPHGGGGPGVGPICVKAFLEPYLPNRDAPISSAPYGSASIVPISWAYILTMGRGGLRKATEVALLNANYLLARLKDHYPILYTNDQGRCAHEFIIDCRPFKVSAGIEVADVAKRLQDYGFHAPTMSWPVPNTLMIEPTESESKDELDRFVDAMVSIREEIREIEDGKQPREGNVLRNAPHTQADLIMGDGDGRWERPYSRATAAYPLPYLREKKFWPSVTRVDDTYGDMNLFCTCPTVEESASQ